MQLPRAFSRTAPRLRPPPTPRRIQLRAAATRRNHYDDGTAGLISETKSGSLCSLFLPRHHFSQHERRPTTWPSSPPAWSPTPRSRRSAPAPPSTTAKTASFRRISTTCARPATSGWRCRGSSAASASRWPTSPGKPGVSPPTPRPPRSAPTCTTTGSASPPTSGGAATGRSNGSSRTRWPARSSPRDTPRAATKPRS